jgi:aminoglycoside 3-N-acetyltransferase I
MAADLRIHRLRAQDLAAMRALNGVFADAFEDAGSYLAAPPSDDHLRSTLAKDDVIALAADLDGTVVGGLVAYELHKLEQARSEVYLYDLAVLASHRRRGIATRLIEHLQAIAQARRAWAVFVQADLVDAPAIALYEKLGVREAVLHFDLPVGAPEQRATPAG